MKIFLLVAIITAAGVLGYFYQNDLKSLNFDTLTLSQGDSGKAYQTYFEGNTKDVQALTTGGQSYLMQDTWLTFSSSRSADLKNEEKYKLIECKAPSEWFMVNTKQIHDLRNLDDLICLELRDANGKKWLVQNVKTNKYYFGVLK